MIERVLPKKHFKNKRRGGYIALVSVLVASALMLLVGIGSSYRGIDGLLSAGAHESALRARSLAEACVNEGIFRLRANLSYGGNETIIVEGGATCRIVSVSGTGNADRTIEAEASDGAYVRKVRVDFKSVQPVIQVRSWEVVAAF